jgi:excisionase family DNA binding protein
LVARLLWEQDVVGSNPAAPTTISTCDLGPSKEGAEWSHGATKAPCSKGVTNGRSLTRKLVPLAGERERLLSVGEVADRLGVSTATVYKLCARGDLGHLRVLNSIRVRMADLVTFINSGACRR